MGKTRKYRRKFGGDDGEGLAWDEEGFVMTPLSEGRGEEESEEVGSDSEEEEVALAATVDPMDEDRKMKESLQTWQKKQDNNKVKEWAINFKNCLIYELYLRGWNKVDLDKLEKSIRPDYNVLGTSKVIYVNFDQSILGLQPASNYPYYKFNPNLRDLEEIPQNAHFTLFTPETNFEGVRGDHITLRGEDPFTKKNASFHLYRSGLMNYKIDTDRLPGNYYVPQQSYDIRAAQWPTGFMDEIDKTKLSQLRDAAWRVAARGAERSEAQIKKGTQAGCISTGGLIGTKPPRQLWTWRAKGGKKTRKQRKQRKQKTKGKKSKARKSKRVKRKTRKYK